MSCKLTIVDHNYAFQDNVDLIASSENIEFPVSNLKKQIRSKVFRTTGYYRITSSNKYINIKDASLGPEITVSLTVGEYTQTTLAAHIKAKLEAASAYTYTVLYSNGYFSISTSGSFLSILFSTGTNAANSCKNVIGFNSNDYTGSVSYIGASVSIHTEEFVIVDLKTAEEIDTFAMVFDPFLEEYFSEDAEIMLQANATLNFDAPAVDVLLSFDTDFETIYYAFSAAQEYRYWKIKIIDTDNQNLFLQFPKIVLGKGIQLTRSVSSGFSLSFNDQSDSQVTQYGHKYSDVYPVKKSLSFSLPFIDENDVGELIKSFMRNGSTNVVFVNIDQLEEIFSNSIVNIYGFYKQDLSLSHIVRNLMNSDLIIEEAF